MASKWSKARNHITDITHWHRYGEPTTSYTARASFIDVHPNKTMRVRGQLQNIDRRKTVATKYCGSTVAKCCWKFSHGGTRYVLPVLHIVTMSLAFYSLCYDGEASLYLTLGLLWVILPIHMLMASNVSILHRIWSRSVMPWLQLYLTILETVAFCDLLNWDARTFIVGPPMLLSQFMITVSDAMYFKPSHKNVIIMMILGCMLWNCLLLLGVRLHYFPRLVPRDLFTIMTTDDKRVVYINNAALFVSKATSVLVCHFGQLWFRCRHPEMMYSLRSHYTLRRNDEWARNEGKFRVTKLKKRQKQVLKARERISDIKEEEGRKQSSTDPVE